LLRELRERARLQDRSFRDLLEHTLQVGLSQTDPPTSHARFQVTPHPLGIKPGFRGMSMNQLYDQIEAEDAARGT
jgi:hypothetical protein